MAIEYLGPLERREHYDSEVIDAALKHGVDPTLAVAVHRQEYNPDRWVSSAGARGPMQLMPGTARELGVDPDDEAGNIDGGVRYLKGLLDQFGGNVPRALAAYNAGPGAVEKAGGVPGIYETQKYVMQVQQRANRLRRSGGAVKIEYLGPLEEETAPEIEYLGPLDEDYAGNLRAGIEQMRELEGGSKQPPTSSNVVRNPIPGAEQPTVFQRGWEKFKELAIPDDVGAAEIPASVERPAIDLSGGRVSIEINPPNDKAAPADEASLFLPRSRAVMQDAVEPEIEYLGPLEGYEEVQPPEVGRSFKNVGAEAAAAFNRGTASFVGKLDDIASWISEETGLPKGGLFEAARREYEKNGDYWERQSDESTLTEEIMGEFLGGAIPGMADFLMGTGVAALHGYSKDGIKGALKEGAERFLLGRALHSMQPLKPVTRGAAFGSLNAAQTAAQGGTAEDIARSAGVGFGLGATGGPGEKGIKGLLEDARNPERNIYRPELQVSAQFGMVTPERFFVEREKNARKEYLTPYTPGEMRGWQHYLTKDGVGFALTPEMDLIGVINNSQIRGKGALAVVAAIEKGAKTCDCIGGHLSDWYPRFGFKEVDRIKWDDRYAPKNWDYKRNGRPDIVFYEYPEGLSRNAFDVEGRFEASWGRGSSLLEPELSGSSSLSDRVNAAPSGPLRGRVVPTEQRAPAEGDRLSGRHGTSELDTQFQNPLKNQSGFVTTEPLQAIVPKIQKIHDYVTIDPLPAMTRLAPRAADGAVEHAAARIAVPKMVKDLLSKVFPNQYHDPQAMARTIDILNKDNVLAGWDAFRERTGEALRRAGTETDPGRKAELLREADKWDDDAHAIAREHDIDAYRVEIGDLIAAASGGESESIEIIGNIQRWKQHVNPLLDQLYNEAKRVDRGTAREERGSFFGARINLTTKERAEELAGFLRDRDLPMPGPSIGSNYRNPNVKHDRFMRQAKFTGDYSTDAELALLNVLGPRWNEVTKIRMFEGLKRAGAAVEGEPGATGPAKIQGQDVTRLAVKLPMTGTDGVTRQVERALWVRKDLAREIRQVLGTDMQLEQNPVAKVLTQIQLAQIADAVTHSKNLLSVVTRAQGAGSIWKDVVRKMPVLGSVDALARISQVAREVAADSPEIRAELANLAKLGVIRPDYPASGIQKITRAQDFLHKLDQGTRIVMNRFFDNLVERGLAVDTPKNRRDYINQCGQYNGRLQGPVMNAFKQSGMSPFIVAGRNFNRQGIRGLTGNPGIQATTSGAALEMRALNWLGTGLTLAAVPMMLNTLTTGNPAGRSGTPLGAWDLGTEENEKGKHRVIDLAQISGLRRGMRVTGMDAVIEGLRAGHTTNQIGGKMVEDVSRNVMHPWFGPAPSGALKAVTGRQLDVRGTMEAHQVPEGGFKQNLENLRAAVESQNPLVYSMARPAFEAAGLEHPPEKTHGEEIAKTFLKSPYGAFGVKDIYPARSAALEMASTMVKGRMPEGITPEQQEKMRVRKEFERAVKGGKPVDEELRKKAQALLGSNDLKAMGKRMGLSDLQNKVKSLTGEEAVKVFEVATPEERAGIAAIVGKKILAGLKGASPEKRSRLLQALRELRNTGRNASPPRSWDMSPLARGVD